jgi:hypothetical protein
VASCGFQDPGRETPDERRQTPHGRCETPDASRKIWTFYAFSMMRAWTKDHFSCPKYSLHTRPSLPALTLLSLPPSSSSSSLSPGSPIHASMHLSCSYSHNHHHGATVSQWQVAVPI